MRKFIIRSGEVDREIEIESDLFNDLLSNAKILINGHRGIGKTYFLEHVLKKYYESCGWLCFLEPCYRGVKRHSDYLADRFRYWDNARPYTTPFTWAWKKRRRRGYEQSRAIGLSVAGVSASVGAAESTLTDRQNLGDSYDGHLGFGNVVIQWLRNHKNKKLLIVIDEINRVDLHDSNFFDNLKQIFDSFDVKGRVRFVASGSNSHFIHYLSYQHRMSEYFSERHMKSLLIDDLLSECIVPNFDADAPPNEEIIQLFKDFYLKAFHGNIRAVRKILVDVSSSTTAAEICSLMNDYITAANHARYQFSIFLQKPLEERVNIITTLNENADDGARELRISEGVRDLIYYNQLLVGGEVGILGHNPGIIEQLSLVR